MQRYMPVAWAGGKAECHKDDRGEYVLHSDAQSRIAELEAERDKWRNECLAANESERKLFQRQAELEADVAKLERERNHFRDQQVEYAMQVNTAWDDALDAAAQYTKEQYGMAFLSNPIDRQRIRALKR